MGFSTPQFESTSSAVGIIVFAVINKKITDSNPLSIPN